jgi:hypothetical protein
MDVSSCETVSHSCIQEFFKIVWNPKVHFRVHKSPPQVLQARSIQSTPPHSISLRLIVILYSHLHLSLPSCLLHSGIPAKNLYAFCLTHAYYMLYLLHKSWHRSNYMYIWRRVQVMKLSLFGQHILLITLFSNTSSLYTSFIIWSNLFDTTKTY